MAIIDDLGLEVKVLVDGAQAAEYQGSDFSETDGDFGAGTAKCHRYIESVDNAEFAIEVSTTTANPWFKGSPNKVLYCSLDLDGKQGVTRKYVAKGHPLAVLDGVTIHEHNVDTLQKFRFAPVHVADDVDDARIEEDEKHAERLGLLAVRICRATRSTRNYKRLSKCNHVREISEGRLSLHERALKGTALSHATVLSPAVTIEPRMIRGKDLKDPINKPLAVFYFKYRSKAALEQKMIIPRPRSPTPPSLDRESLPGSVPDLTTPHPRSPFPSPLDRGSLPGSVTNLLSGELLGRLAFDEVLRLAHQRLSGTGGPLDSLTVSEVRRLADETLENLPLREVRRLAQQTPSTNDLAPGIKRENDEALVSEQPRKFLKTEGGKEAIDLTED